MIKREENFARSEKTGPQTTSINGIMISTSSNINVRHKSQLQLYQIKIKNLFQITLIR